MSFGWGNCQQCNEEGRLRWLESDYIVKGRNLFSMQSNKEMYCLSLPYLLNQLNHCSGVGEEKYPFVII